MNCPHCGKVVIARLEKDSNVGTSQPAVNVDPSDLGDLLALATSLPLSEWEQQFVSDQKERFEKYGERIRVSEKQMATLRKIVNGDS